MPTFQRPINIAPSVSCSFGCHTSRQPPSVNPGCDYRAAIGIPVYAPESGTIAVDDDNSSGAAGISLVIFHDNGWSSDIMHLTRNVVTSGMKVARGQLVGYSGNTGASTGPHVHWSLRPVHSASYSNRGNVDPELYVGAVTPPVPPNPTPSTDDEAEMRLARDVTTGTIWFYTSNGRVGISTPAHVTLLSRLIASGANYQNFYGAELDIIFGYIVAASVADDAETAKILAAIAAKTIDPAPVAAAAAVAAAKAVEKALTDANITVEIDYNKIIEETAVATAAALESQFAEIPDEVADEAADRLDGVNDGQ